MEIFISSFIHPLQVTHQHVHVQHPAVLSRTDAEGTQVHALSVVEHFIECVTKLHPQLLPSTPLKLWSGICWATKINTHFIMVSKLMWHQLAYKEHINMHHLWIFIAKLHIHTLKYRHWSITAPSMYIYGLNGQKKTSYGLIKWVSQNLMH